MNRRDFLKAIGIGGVGAGVGFKLGESTHLPVAELMPYLVLPEDVIPGVANHYSTLCTQCSAGCGIQVRVLEGRVKKIEGNPNHPLNYGRACLRGQAGPHMLYNPDRIKNPLKRTGDRGKGQFQEISWEEALAEITKNLSDLATAGEADKLHLVTSPVRGHLNKLIDTFMTSFGSPNYHQHELYQHKNLHYANKVTMGIDTLPFYDIENTKYLLSFGADFSSTWLSPVGYSYNYGKMRQGGGKRGKLVQVESRMSLTGANADKWIAPKPGTEAILALSIASAIVEKGYYTGKDAGEWASVLSRYSPKDASAITDIKEERIYDIAKEFAETRPSLAIGGENLHSYENGVSGLVAVNILNHLAGNIGIKGGVVLNPELPMKAGRTNYGINTLISDAANGKIKTLVLYNTNPVFTTPKSSKLEEALKNIPFIASFSSFKDETSGYADLILPAHTSYEDWGDDFAEPSIGHTVATIMQPAILPAFKTMGLGDMIITIGKGVEKTKDKMPGGSFGEYILESWKAIYDRNKTIASSFAGFEEFWNKFLETGNWAFTEEAGNRTASISASSVASYLPQGPAAFEGQDNPYYLSLYAHSGHFDGRGANAPWLQEIADTMTSITWGSWVEINPKTMEKLGIKEGDVVAIESPFGKIELPAYPYPGIRPDTVAVPIGQGHTSYGKYADMRGANPIEILPFKEDARTGAPALNSTQVKITPTGRCIKFAKLEGSRRELGRNIVRTVPA